eukprot:13065435-Alexandrium_andersonii.AAC.1
MARVAVFLELPLLSGLELSYERLIARDCRSQVGVRGMPPAQLCRRRPGLHGRRRQAVRRERCGGFELSLIHI